MTDIDPAIVEAALREFTKPRMYTGMSLDATRGKLTAALEAVAPMIAAKALRDEADRLEGMAYGCTGRYTDAGRHIIARIRDRADALEAGAVR